MFTENQSRQFYVLTATSADVIAPLQVDSSHAATDLSAKSAGACQFVINPTGDEAYFTYKGPSDDGVQRTDIIKKCNIISVTGTAAADMEHKKKKLEVTLDSTVNSGNPVVGQDYILDVNIKNYILIDNASNYNKYGCAHAFTATASDLYKNLALSLAKNLSREAAKLIKITLKGDAGHNEVLPNSDMSASPFSGVTATGIELEEVEQPWRRGAAPQEFVDFEVVPSTIWTGTDDRIWGTVTDLTASNTNVIVNSKYVADMEWFFHKERGDKYGEIGWPNNIDTTYQVNPSNAYGYSFIDIHYYTEGNSHNVGKSEKTITIVSPGVASNPEALLQKLIGSARVTGGSPADPTGLYAFVEDTPVNIKLSTSWDAA